MISQEDNVLTSLLLPSSPADNMPTAAKPAAGKKQKPAYVPKKATLMPPLETTWPALTPEQLQEVTDLIDTCAHGTICQNPEVKPKWNELQKIERSQRKDAISKYQQNHLDSLSPSEKEQYEKNEAIREEKLSHIFLGYNKIMRELETGTVAAALINKTSQPDMLPKSIVQACEVSEVPCVAVDNLDKFYRRSIAIAFKSSVSDIRSSFYPLYKKIVEISKEATKLLSDEPMTVTLCPSPVDTDAAPAFDFKKYHLKRTREDQSTFVPGIGMNPKAMMSETEFIMIGRDDPLLDCPVELLTNFGSRKSVKRKPRPQNKYTNYPDNENASPPETLKIKRNVKKVASDDLFELDFGDDELAPVKRKHSSSPYVTAQVNNFKPNPNKKSKKTQNSTPKSSTVSKPKCS